MRRTRFADLAAGIEPRRRHFSGGDATSRIRRMSERSRSGLPSSPFLLRRALHIPTNLTGVRSLPYITLSRHNTTSITQRAGFDGHFLPLHKPTSLLALQIRRAMALQLLQPLQTSKLRGYQKIG